MNKNNLKKFLLVFITAVLGVMSSGAMAAPTYTATVNGTSYDFTYVTGTYTALSSTYSNTTYMPWWGDSTSATTFASTVGNNLGLPINNAYGPMFAYATDASLSFSDVNLAVFIGSYQTTVLNTANSSDLMSYAVIIPTAAVPEIDGALIPQVGFLIACLFIILGRRKESTELKLAA